MNVVNIVRPIGQRKSPKSFCAVGPDLTNSDIHGLYDIHDIHGLYDIHGFFAFFFPGSLIPDSAWYTFTTAESSS